ncbi:MAG: Glutathione peroxidase @ Thioredoxin peroxidase, partial [uncultured Friedmanniella sp.]
ADPLRLHRPLDHRDRGPARRLRRPPRAGGQHRLAVRADAPVRGPGEAVEHLRPRRARGLGLPLRPVRSPGARRRDGDRRLLRAQLRRDLPAVRQGRGQRGRRAPAVPLAPGRAARRLGRGDRVELHQVPPRPRRPRRAPLRPRHHAGRDRRRPRGCPRRL